MRPCARALRRLDHDARPLMGDLVAVPAQAGDVQQHVGHAVVRHDEAEAFGDIEPFDAAADLNEIQGPVGRGILASGGVYRWARRARA
jgi:hypothetical protein